MHTTNQQNRRSKKTKPAQGSSKQHGGAQANKKIYRMFVGGLSFKVDNKILKQHFEDFGNIKKALIIRDPKSGQSKGYGFITFTSKHSYDSALSTETVILGRKADCYAVMTKSSLKEKVKQDVNNKIFVGGISQSTRTEHLIQYFSKFGKVLDARILYDGNTGMSRGFGFVLFEKKEATNRLFAQPGFEHRIKGKRIECKLFENKNNKIGKKGGKKKAGRKGMDRGHPSEYSVAGSCSKIAAQSERKMSEGAIEQLDRATSKHSSSDASDLGSSPAQKRPSLRSGTTDDQVSLGFSNSRKSSIKAASHDNCAGDAKNTKIGLKSGCKRRQSSSKTAEDQASQTHSTPVRELQSAPNPASQAPRNSASPERRFIIDSVFVKTPEPRRKARMNKLALMVSSSSYSDKITQVYDYSIYSTNASNSNHKNMNVEGCQSTHCDFYSQQPPSLDQYTSGIQGGPDHFGAYNQHPDPYYRGYGQQEQPYGGVQGFNQGFFDSRFGAHTSGCYNNSDFFQSNEKLYNSPYAPSDQENFEMSTSIGYHGDGFWNSNFGKNGSFAPQFNAINNGNGSRGHFGLGKQLQQQPLVGDLLGRSSRKEFSLY